LKENKTNRNKKNILGKNKVNILLIVVGAILLLADQILKQFFTSHSYSAKFFSLHLVKNTGMSFGLLPGKVIWMIIASIIFLFLLYYFRDEFKGCKACAMLLVSGTLGNLIDRIFRGYVIDYVDLGWFPVFNLADAMISVGTLGIVILFIKEIAE
jgi:signal peptidase II